MQGWKKLGDLLDKRRDEPASEVPKQGLMARLGAMVAKLERRINDAFNRGQVAASRFNGADAVNLPQAPLEEVIEKPAAQCGVTVGRFEHVRTVRLAGDFEEVHEH